MSTVGEEVSTVGEEVSMAGEEVRRNWRSLAAAAVLTDWTAASPTRAGRTGLSSSLPLGDTRDVSSDTAEK